MQHTSVPAKSFLNKCTEDGSILSQCPNLTVSYVNNGLTLEVMGYNLSAALDKFNEPSCALIHPFLIKHTIYLFPKNWLSVHVKAKLHQNYSLLKLT